MSDKKSVTVNIYGNEYTLKGEADPQYIAELAKFVDAKMTDIGKKSSAPAAKVAILASMNIADELHRLEKAKAENLKLIETLEKNLLDMKKSSDGSLKHTLEIKEQLDKHKGEVSDYKKKFEEATAELLKLRKQAETSVKELEEHKAHAEKAKQEFEDMRKNSSGSKGELEKLKQELEKTKAEFEKEKAKTEEVMIEEEDFKSQVSHLNSEITDLRESLEKSKQELEKIRHGKPEGPSAPSGSFLPTDDKLNSLFKKIDAILE